MPTDPTTFQHQAIPAWQGVTHHVCSLGESPFWHPHEQMLYWLDIAGRQLLRANIYMDTVEVWNLPSEPGCMAPAEGGGLVLALRDGVYRARQWQGALQCIATLGYDPAQQRANDGKCDVLGRFWVGTIDETRQRKNAALYCIDARAAHGNAAPEVQCKIGPTAGITTANGLAFSPDNGTLYWADTPQHTVWCWRWDAASNAMTEQRVFAHFSAKPSGWTSNAADPNNGAYGGRPDGAAVDSMGNYWVAMYEGRRLCRFAPDGVLLAAYALPLQCPTMPCFGGEDLKTLYLTTAKGHGSEQAAAASPCAGQVIAMRVDVAGLPVNFFVDGR